MPRDASELSRRLARDAEAVCRHYLSNGRRQGRYWTVGDVRNTPGRSMFVRLSGPDSGPGAAGSLDRCRLGRTWRSARRDPRELRAHRLSRRRRGGAALSEPAAAEPRHSPSARSHTRPRRIAGSGAAAVRHVAADPPDARRDLPAHSRHQGLSTMPVLCGSIRAAAIARTTVRRLESRPAMIAAVTDLDGKITGAHRTWLAPDGFGKAPVDTPRRAMGGLLGHAVRFGAAVDVLAVGEGIETMLSLRWRCLPCRWRPRSRPTTLPLFCSRRRCVGSTSPATLMPRATGARGLDRTRAQPRASRRWPCLRGWATSTRTCKHSASARCGQRLRPSSRRRMRLRFIRSAIGQNR